MISGIITIVAGIMGWLLKRQAASQEMRDSFKAFLRAAEKNAANSKKLSDSYQDQIKQLEEAPKDVAHGPNDQA